MPLGFPAVRDETNPITGTVTRFFAGSQTGVVVVRGFGLTTEPECSEEAHEMMRWWMDTKHPDLMDAAARALGTPYVPKYLPGSPPPTPPNP